MPESNFNVLPFARFDRLDERLQLVLDTLPVGVSWADIRTQEIEFVNRAFVNMFGYTRDEIPTVPVFLAHTGLDPERQRQALENINPQHARGKSGAFETVPAEVEVKCRDGSKKTVVYAGIFLPDAGWTVATFMDVTERKQREARMIQLSETDALTGLLNRRSFDEALLDAVQTSAEAEAGGKPGETYVLLIDLDGFKQVNDKQGHLTGDEILISAARRLKMALRDGDALARWGGDEFAAILGPPTDRAKAQMVARRIKQVFSAPFNIEGKQIRVGASVGMAGFPHDANNAHDLYRLADEAMYEEKRRKPASRWRI